LEERAKKKYLRKGKPTSKKMNQLQSGATILKERGLYRPLKVERIKSHGWEAGVSFGRREVNSKGKN